MVEDDELDILLEKRLSEMKRRLRSPPPKPQGETPSVDVLKGVFEGRAWEVLSAARHQYPQEARQVEKALSQAVSTGALRGKVRGEDLYHLFRSLGVRVKLRTSIRVLKGGKLQSLAEMLKESSTR